ncbi:MAG: PKD domain-containing protein [Bacteroidota bacterium]
MPGAGFSNYLWQDNSANASLLASTAGTYTVTVTDANGCTDADSLLLSVIQTPMANFSFIPLGTTIAFTDLSTNAPSAWHWDFGNGDSSNIQNPAYNYNATGIFTVCLTVANQGCSSDTCIDVPVMEVSRAPALATEVNIYPQPVHSDFKVWVIGIDLMEAWRIDLCDLYGRTVRTWEGLQGNLQTLNAEGVPAGTYILRMRMETGLPVATEKIWLH